MRTFTVPAVWLALVIVGAAQHSSFACPACGPVLTATLSERLARSDAAVLAQWADGQQRAPDGKVPASTTFAILQVARAPERGLKTGGRIELPRHIAGSRGDLFLLIGKRQAGAKEIAIEWDDPLEVTETGYYYVTQAPSPEAAGPERLKYFLKFFEYPDPLIADDAYAEFAKAPFKDVTAVRESMPREKLRKWLTDAATPQTRIGLYGLMLGLCGTRHDIPLMEKIVTDDSQEFRLGLDGVIFGYLMLTGEKGLDLIDKTKLENEKAPFNETYSAMQAVRIMWTYGDGRIAPDRLRQSMRLLLDRPDLAEIVIADLARWNDWSVQDRLMELYDSPEHANRRTRLAIIRYMLASTKNAAAKSDAAEPPAHIARGREYLKILKKKNRKLYDEAVRFAF